MLGFEFVFWWKSEQAELKRINKKKLLQTSSYLKYKVIQNKLKMMINLLEATLNNSKVYAFGGGREKC